MHFQVHRYPRTRATPTCTWPEYKTIYLVHHLNAHGLICFVALENISIYGHYSPSTKTHTSACSIYTYLSITLLCTLDWVLYVRLHVHMKAFNMTI